MGHHTTGCHNQSVLRGMVVGGMVGALLIGTLAGFEMQRSAIVHAEMAEDYETVSGTLGMVNVAQKKGTITTDVGKEVPFQITKPELFINLSSGQRVTIKLDKEGRAVRVMESAGAPELPPPSIPK